MTDINLFHELVNQVENVKKKLTDREYKVLVESVAAIRNGKETRIYNIDMFIPYVIKEYAACGHTEYRTDVVLLNEHILDINLDYLFPEDCDELMDGLDALESRTIKWINNYSIADFPRIK